MVIRGSYGSSDGVDSRFEISGVSYLSFGSARSGKSTLAKLASSFDAVDHQDEPFDVIAIAAAHALEMCSTENARWLLRASIAELTCESVLLRRANFRPFDTSSIWHTSRILEIVERLLSLKSRDDASRYVLQENFKLWVTCTDLLPQIGLFEVMGDNFTQIIVVRDPMEVAQATRSKNWFSDASLLAPRFNTPVTSYARDPIGQRFYLPWWLHMDDYENFVYSDELTRGLIYWKSIYKLYFHSKSTKTALSPLFLFDDIVNRPTHTLDCLGKILNRKPTVRSKYILNKIALRTEDNVETTPSSRLMYDELYDLYKTAIGLSSVLNS